MSDDPVFQSIVLYIIKIKHYAVYFKTKIVIDNLGSLQRVFKSSKIYIVNRLGLHRTNGLSVNAK